MRKQEACFSQLGRPPPVAPRSTDLGGQGEKTAKARTPAADRRRQQAKTWEPSQQAANGNASLEARDVETGADVGTRAKRQVPIWLARNIEKIGICELGGVAIGGADPDGEERAGRHAHAADVGWHRRHAVAELIGAFKA